VDRFKIGWVHVYDASNNDYFSIRYQENNPNAFPAIRSGYIRENPAGVLWIGTDNGGLKKVLLDDNRKTPAVYSL